MSSMRVLHRRRMDGFRIAGLALAVLIAGLIIWPIGKVLLRTFFPDGSFNAGPLVAVLGMRDLATVLLHTLLVVLVSAALALGVGALFAWLTERTDVGLGWLVRLLPIMPLLVPPIAGAIGWVLLAAPKAGFVNGALRALFDQFGIHMFSGPLSIFSWYGLIFVYVLYLVPETFLTVSAGLRNVDPALDEAARMNGSGPVRTLLLVTLPSVKPALASSAVLALLTGFALFSVPVIIGPQAGVHVLSVRVVDLMTASYPPRTGMALILGLLVFAVTGAAWYVQSRILRARRFAVIGGRGMRHRSVRLGAWRIPARSALLLYLVFACILPFLALLVVSLEPFWSAQIAPSRFSVRNYAHLLLNNFNRSALIDSMGLGIATATCGIAVAAIMAVVIQRGGRRFAARAIDFVTKLPGAMSHLVIAIAFITAFSGPPFNLNGTILLLLLAYLLMFMPQATLSASAALAQVGQELSEASIMAGATRGATFRRIVAPLMAPGLAGAWVLLFVLGAGEITASSMLAGAGNPVVGFVVLDLWSSGSYSDLAAFGTLISLVTSSVVLTTLWLTRRQH